METTTTETKADTTIEGNEREAGWAAVRGVGPDTDDIVILGVHPSEEAVRAAMKFQGPEGASTWRPMEIWYRDGDPVSSYRRRPYPGERLPTYRPGSAVYAMAPRPATGPRLPLSAPSDYGLTPDYTPHS